jgi:hypothetical protein
MQRVLALILSLIVCLAPAFPAAGVAPRSVETNAGCCGGERGEPCCPLCAELQHQARHCPCAPAPEQPSGGFERDQAATTPAAARGVVVRATKVAEPIRPELWTTTVSLATPRRFAPTAAAGRPQPLRAALCIWTT